MLWGNRENILTAKISPFTVVFTRVKSKLCEMDLSSVSDAALCIYDCHSPTSFLQGHLDPLRVDFVNWRAATCAKVPANTRGRKAADASTRVTCVAIIVVSMQIESYL